MVIAKPGAGEYNLIRTKIKDSIKGSSSGLAPSLTVTIKTK